MLCGMDTLFQVGQAVGGENGYIGCGDDRPGVNFWDNLVNHYPGVANFMALKRFVCAFNGMCPHKLTGQGGVQVQQPVQIPPQEPVFQPEPAPQPTKPRRATRKFRWRDLID